MASGIGPGLEVVGEGARPVNGAGTDPARVPDGVARLVSLGRALSDPIRVRMLGMMAEGRTCCGLSGAATEEDGGICVCEFEEAFSMGQSKVSYHMKKLKEAGLVREERRGRWRYYSLDRGAAEGLLGEAAGRLLPDR